ncbi:MAG: tRNA U-34 5-methylaminomethyl-2-thiouridine biosynthesis protein [Kordiimonas sp.]|nr:tRNA U-34 5-methylaminomethyl-2-thiouridine biosynthesis protein [Kordiimonas sp.]
MTVVSAFIIPASPLPMVHGSNPPWGAFAEAMDEAGRRLAETDPDVILIYSTAWYAVLDQLWQMRAHVKGVHVDENWHEYGNMPFDMHIHQPYTAACIEATAKINIRSRAVDYDAFPIDTGTIGANHFLNKEHKYKLAITSNNLYHDGRLTGQLARVAAKQADQIGLRVAVVGIGGLSGSFFRHEINIADDRIENPIEDNCNKEFLTLIEQNDGPVLLSGIEGYVPAARADMGMKHLYFVLGAMADDYQKAEVLHYGPLYGAGGAVISFVP